MKSRCEFCGEWGCRTCALHEEFGSCACGNPAREGSPRCEGCDEDAADGAADECAACGAPSAPLARDAQGDPLCEICAEDEGVPVCSRTRCFNGRGCPAIHTEG